MVSRWMASIAVAGLAGTIGCRSEAGGDADAADASSEVGETDADTTGDGDGDGDGDPGCPDPLVRVFGAALPDDAVGVGELAVAGETVYACTADGGLTTWTLGDDEITLTGGPVSPDDLPVGCKRLAVDAASNRVVVSRSPMIDEPGHVVLFDVAQPPAPQAIAQWTTPDAVEGVALAAGRVYVGLRGAGIVVLEPDGMGGMTQVGAVAGAGVDARGLVARDGTLFVAQGKYGLSTYDIAGDDPVELATLGLGGLATQLSLSGERAHVATLTGIAIVDVADVAAPELLGQVETPGAALAVAVDADGAGDVAHVADWNELRSWDTTDPILPRALAAERPPTAAARSRIRGVAVLDDGRVVAGEWSGLHVYARQEQPDGCPAPEILLSREVLRFDPLEGVSSRDELLLVENEGPGVLEVTDIVTSDPAVQPDVTAFEVAPGASAPVEVLLTSDAALKGTLTFHTNDPDEPMLVLPWETADFKRDVGDDPPALFMVDLDANVWRTSDVVEHVTLLAYFATW